MRRLAAFLLLLAACNPTPSEHQPPETAAPSTPIRDKKQFVNQPVLEFSLQKLSLSTDRAVELWIRSEGESWQQAATAPVAGGRMKYTVSQDGFYECVLVPVDGSGKRLFLPSPATKPDHIVVVDTIPPVVEVLAPNGSEILPPNAETEVRWRCVEKNLGSEAVRIESSLDGGETWAVLAPRLANSGKHRWKTPAGNHSSVLLRIMASDLAGNSSQDSSDAPFRIDERRPEPRLAVSPSSNRLPVEIPYSVEGAAPSSLVRVQLYVTSDAGKTWRLHQEMTEIGKAFSFPGPEGIYGLEVVGMDSLGHTRPVPVPGMTPTFVLTLDATPPVVQVTAPRAARVSLGQEIPVEWTATDNIRIPDDGVTLAVSVDDGKSWTPLAARQANVGRYSGWKISGAPGSLCRVQVTVEDGAGNRSSAVSDALAIEGAPVAAAVPASGDVRIASDFADGATLAPSSRWMVSWKPTEPVEKAKLAVVRVLQQGGEVAQVLVRGASAQILTPSREGDYELRLDWTSADDRTFSSNTIRFHVRVPEGPSRFELVTFKGGEYYAAGSAQLIQLRAERVDVSQARVSWSPQGGADGTWLMVPEEDLERKPDGLLWRRLPAEKGEKYRIRVEATGAAGPVEARSTRDFSVESEAPQVRIAGPARSAQPARLLVETVQPTLAPLESMTLWVRSESAGGWQVYADFKANHPVLFQPERDGEYEIYLTASNAAGLSMAPPQEVTKGWRIFVGNPPPPSPILELQTMKGGEVYAGGATRLIGFRAENIDREQIEVEWSDASGAAGTWRKVPRRDLKPMEGGLLWRNLPTGSRSTYRIRLSWKGNVLTESASDFTIDADVPGIEFLRQKGDHAPVELEIRVQAPVSGVAELTLWVTRDQGRTWEAHRSFEAGQKVLFYPDLPGDYGIYFTGRSRAGLVGDPPDSKTVPRMIRVASATEAMISSSVELQVPMTGGVLRGGSVVPISWSVARAEAEGAQVQLDFLVEGREPRRIREGGATGSVDWKVPEEDGLRGRIQATVLRAGKTSGTAALSATFSVDSRAPEVTGATVAEAE